MDKTISIWGTMVIAVCIVGSTRAVYWLLLGYIYVEFGTSLPTVIITALIVRYWICCGYKLLISVVVGTILSACSKFNTVDCEPWRIFWLGVVGHSLNVSTCTVIIIMQLFSLLDAFPTWWGDWRLSLHSYVISQLSSNWQCVVSLVTSSPHRQVHP